MSLSDRTGRLVLCVRNIFDVEFACEKYFIAFVCLSATNISVGVLFDTTSSTGGKNVIIRLVDTFENGTFIAVGAFIVSRKLFSTLKGGFISSTTRDVFGGFFLYLRLRYMKNVIPPATADKNTKDPTTAPAVVELFVADAIIIGIIAGDIVFDADLLSERLSLLDFD
jgi:hypothetical protein